MSAKEIVENFYKNDAFLDSNIIKEYMHPEILLDWNSSTGFIQMNYDSILNLSEEMGKSYIRSKIRISHIIEENNVVSIRFSHFAKTFENPREDMLLAHFITIWEIKDNKLFRGYQISQF